MAAKKTTSKKGGSGSSKKTPPKKSQPALSDSSNKPIRLSIAFIISLFLAAIVYIPAGGAWGSLRNLFFGVFGFTAFLIPLFAVFLIIASAAEKNTGKFKHKVAEGAAFYTLLIAFIFIIKADVSLDFKQQITEAFNTYKNYSEGITEAPVYGFGVYGAFFGSLPFLLTAWNKVAAGAIAAILLLVVFLLFTGTTLLKIVQSLKKPAGAVSRYADEKREDIIETYETVVADVQEHREDRRERTAERRAKSSERRKKREEYFDDSQPERREETFDDPQSERRDEPFDEHHSSRWAYDIQLDTGTGTADMGQQDFMTDVRSGEIELLASGTEKKKSGSRFSASQRKPQPPVDVPDDPDAAEEPTDESDDVIDLFKKHTEAISVPSETSAPQPEPKPFSQPQPFAAPTPKKPRAQDAVSAPARADAQSVQQESAAEPAAEPEVKEYQLPPLDCLFAPESSSSSVDADELHAKADTIVRTLKSFGVGTKLVNICRSPSVTRFELQPDPGVKISRISNLADDIAMNLAASGVRIEAPIPNKNAVGIEVPNSVKTTVTMREILDTPGYKGLVAKSKLAVALGRDIQGEATCTDLAKMPHLLVAGTTGSGKSVCMNTMIVSILFNAKPDEVKLIMIDPKKVEFTLYASIPHLLVPVVTDPRKAAGALSWAASEMDKRYAQFAETGVRNLQGYNKYAEENGLPKLPQIVIFIDELAELMMVASKEVEDSICRLAQKARAAGMHLVIATQRPSVDVITGLIKANIPSRIALAVKSQIDSRTIIDTQGAEKLLGNGDMLFCPVGLSKPARVQGAYLRDEEIENVIDFIKSQGEAEYDSSVIREMDEKAVQDDKKKGSAIASDDGGEDVDEMIPKAIEVVVECGSASTTLLQRRLKLGYARAARIIEYLDTNGIIGPYEGAKPRKVLITKEQWYEMQARSADTAPRQLSLEEASGGDYGYMFEDDGDSASGGEEHNYFGQASAHPDGGEE